MVDVWFLRLFSALRWLKVWCCFKVVVGTRGKEIAQRALGISYAFCIAQVVESSNLYCAVWEWERKGATGQTRNNTWVVAALVFILF